MLSSNLGSESQQPSPATPQSTEGGTFHHWWRITQPPTITILLRRSENPLTYPAATHPRSVGGGGDNSSESVLRDEVMKDLIILLTKF
ncbi:hypothetical protein AVEN_120683-1 [Araneus ventricosus]|uniref:Uncharacterized protein n=1 Tax=Araneus ventricosus TaxID=182803 RepID=A0A4Y2LX29_ARAVE|nr:hypothetical protein AVEN_120683-1 [Araneus ventricosus]